MSALLDWSCLRVLHTLSFTCNTVVSGFLASLIVHGVVVCFFLALCYQFSCVSFFCFFFFILCSQSVGDCVSLCPVRVILRSRSVGGIVSLCPICCLYSVAELGYPCQLVYVVAYALVRRVFGWHGLLFPFFECPLFSGCE